MTFDKFARTDCQICKKQLANILPMLGNIALTFTPYPQLSMKIPQTSANFASS